MRYPNRGIGLVEILVGMIVLSVILVIAVPNYLSFNHNRALDATNSRLINDLNLAKSKAQQLNSQVILCSKAPDSLSCGGPDNWANGWLILTLPANNIIASHENADDALTFKTSAASLIFTAKGFANSNFAMSLSSPHCTGAHQYTISVNTKGQITSSASKCP